jgi:hypothetical protein
LAGSSLHQQEGRSNEFFRTLADTCKVDQWEEPSAKRARVPDIMQRGVTICWSVGLGHNGVQISGHRYMATRRLH